MLPTARSPSSSPTNGGLDATSHSLCQLHGCNQRKKEERRANRGPTKQECVMQATLKLAAIALSIAPGFALASSDFNGDGRSDVLWRNSGTGANVIWHSANSATLQSLAAVSNFDWRVVGNGDYDGDGRADLLWRNCRTGGNAIWRSANWLTPQAVTTGEQPGLVRCRLGRLQRRRSSRHPVAQHQDRRQRDLAFRQLRHPAGHVLGQAFRGLASRGFGRLQRRRSFPTSCGATTAPART